MAIRPDAARRVRVLTLLDYYAPGNRSGGPVRTLTNMVAQLPEVEFFILTRDRDFGDATQYPQVTPGAWNQVGRAHVFYASPSQIESTRLLRRVVEELAPEVVYLNSFFSRLTIRYLVARRVGLVPPHPVIVAPRGEFSAAALGLKHGRKQLFIAAARRSGLYREVLWQASSADEEAQIRAIFGPGQRAQVAPDLTNPPGSVQAERAPKLPGTARFVYVSRVTPMKNLAFGIECLRRAREPVQFTIFGGIDDDAYWQQCQALLRALPPHVRATYGGVLPAEAVPDELRRHDFFLLPTLGENFGHAIFEALAAGCPPLISDRTPWRGLSRCGAGWDLPLETPARWDEVIAHCVRMGPAEHSVLCAGARSFARRYAERTGARGASLELFARASGKPLLGAEGR